MDIEKIRQLRLADPFKPFYLVLNDGRQLPVERAFYLALSPTKTFVAYSPPEGGVKFISMKEVADVVVDENMSTPWMGRLKHG